MHAACSGNCSNRWKFLEILGSTPPGRTTGSETLWILLHTYDAFVCEPCLIHVFVMHYLIVWHEWFTRLAWLIQTLLGVKHCGNCWVQMCSFHNLLHWNEVSWLIYTGIRYHDSSIHDSYIHVIWIIYTRDMTHLYMWHESCIHVTWLIHTCDMSHLCMCHDSFILIYTCDMPHLYMWHASFIHVPWLIIHTCDMTHSYTWRNKCNYMRQLINMYATT